MSSSDRPHATSWARREAGEVYEQGRPGYPRAAGALLVEHLRLRSGSRVADVAAGTGKLTRLLAEAVPGQIVAVEPMAGMRAQLTAQSPGIAVMAAGVERLPLASGSLDAVTVAQAFHWFDVPTASAELARVLRPSGKLALVTNRPDHTTTWQADLWATLRRYEVLAPRPATTRGWRQALDATGDFTAFERFEISHRQAFTTRDAFEARFGSISHVLLLEPATRRQLFGELHAIVAGQDQVVIALTTVIEIASVASASAPFRSTGRP
ncbi:MAG: methyltransferase domain-containing protein [Actinomycetota bacterium]|nr:methyltransferase domain-containing protein [Actinomycetota bacterium]